MIWTARNRIPKWWNILGRSFCFMGAVKGRVHKGTFRKKRLEILRTRLGDVKILGLY